MNVATPHSLPDGDRSSAGMNVSTAATTKACSVGVSVSSGSGCGAAAAGCAPATAAFAACACAAGAIPAATAVPATPAPHRNLRRGIVSSAMASLPCRGIARLRSRLRGRIDQTGAALNGSMCALAHASCASAVNAGDRQKFFGCEARAADQGAVDIINRHQLRGVVRLHRSAIEDADLLCRLTIAGGERLANEAVHIGDVSRRWRQSGTDRPDRLVGDGEIGRAVRRRTLDLPAHHGAGMTGIALGTRFADTNNGREAGPPGGKRLVADHCVALAVIVAALGMADDD